MTHRLRIIPLLQALWFSAVVGSVLPVKVSADHAGAPPEIQRQVDQFLEQGKFIDAAQYLRRQLNPLPEAAPQRQGLLFELDRLDRIKRDFPLTESELFSRLQKHVKDLRWDEFQTWIRDGWFDTQNVDGERRFMVSSVSNLFFRHDELQSRRVSNKSSAEYQRRLIATARKIRASAAFEDKPYVLPITFRVEMTLKVKPDAATPGEILRAWMPIPRKYPFQDGFRVLSSSPPVRDLAPEDSPIRSAMFERRHNERGTEFELHYEYSARGVWFDINPAKIRTGLADSNAWHFTNQAPHISFSSELRALSDRLASTETNAWAKAKRFYEWISENIKYSYAIEYSTIRNISDYCLERGYGDCGQEALLFMSLCRLNGIPARWQSGWSIFPDAKTIHDWTEIYLEPYGWIPVDPYMGIFAMQYATSLSIWERLELRDFYFGGLDQYRLIANSDHSQPLTPPKRSLRSDTVDFQRGELEQGDRNIFFDQFDYELNVKELKSQPTPP